MPAQKIGQPAKVRDWAMYPYVQRQFYELNAERIKDASQKIQPAGNFHFNGCEWLPNEYKGYAVVSMLSDNPGNETLVPLLTSIQRELQDNLQPLNSFYMLPPASFHQTVANTLSADRFKANILYAGLEEVYPGMIKSAFDQTIVTRQPHPIRMRLAGLSVFGTSIGVLGTFENEADYNRILAFRAGLYEDHQLSKLDVKMTRPFVGHITLAYAEHRLNKNQREHLANTINEINESVFSKKHYFVISHTGLRKYDHLAEFQNADDFPVYQFTL